MPLPRLPSAAAALSLAACAAAPPPAVPAPAGADALTVAALTAQAHRWDRAIVAKDGAAVAANVADDFRQIDGAGRVRNKAEFLAAILAPALTIDPYAVDDLDVRVHGDVALLSGTTRMTGRWDGAPFASHYRYVDVYLRRDGVWQVVSVQITPLADAR